MSTYHTYIVVTLGVAAPASILYAFFFMFRPWYTTPQGRALAIMSWGTAVLLGRGLAAVMWHDYPLQAEIRAAAFTLFAVGIVYLLGTLLASPGARRYPPYSWRRRPRNRRPHHRREREA